MKQKSITLKIMAVIAGIVVILAIASIVLNKASPTPGKYKEITDSLKTANLTLSEGAEISQPFIPAAGKIYTISGEDVQLYEFESDKDARDFSLTVLPDATQIGNSNILWVGDPHLFMSGNVMAIYVGSSQPILSALASAMGTQFAGSGSTTYCTSESRKGDVCIQTYSPVCGWYKPSVQCATQPCAETYSNNCFACKDDKVLYYTSGECAAPVLSVA